MLPRRLTCLTLMVILAGVSGVAVATQPPKDLHKVDDHWTAWDPPTSFPEGAEIYIIERGDTLWDLSNRFFGDPYLWPQLWERNQYILDAHWIYPGDPLVVGLEVTPIDELAMKEDLEGLEEVPEGDELFDRAPGAPVPLGSEDDIYCSGYIGDPDQEFSHQITGAELEKITHQMRGRRITQFTATGAITDTVGLSVTDIVYVNGGRHGGLVPGDVLTVVAPQQIVKHPYTNEPLGRFYRYMGRIRVLSVQEVAAIAEIVHACYPINVGHSLQPFEPQPVPLSRRSGMIGFNLPVSHEELDDAATIVMSEPPYLSMGEGHLVFVDRGEQDVTPGDIFTIYREPPPDRPPVVVGELGILSVEETASLARILESRYAVHVGDLLDPKYE